MKSLTLVLCVIAILGAAASTYFYIDIGNKKEVLEAKVATTETRANDLQTKLTEAAAQGEALQKRLATLDSDLGEAKSKSTAAETKGTQLSRDVAQLRNQLTAKEDTERTLNREISDLKGELARAKLSASAATPEEIEGYKTKIATLEARVTELEAGRGSIVTGAANTTAGSASGTTAVQAPSGLTGQVVSIGAQNAFVVLNVGAAKGVQAGQTFTLTRSGTTVATVQVSSVQDNFSIAQVASDSIRGGLSKGDTATIATPAAK